VPVGKTLAAARRSQGLALADIEHATRIMGRLLTALEEERWDDLPPAAYVKGYIQNYAQALGLDPHPLIEEYERDTGHAERPTPLTHIPERTIVPHRHDAHQLPKAVWVGLAVALVIIGLVAWWVSALLGGDDTPPPIAPEPTATAEPTTTAGTGDTVDEPIPADGEEGGGEGTTDPAAGPFTLEVTVADGQASWLRITVDGLVAYEGTTAGGGPRTWTVAETATVRIGNPAVVSVTRDGEPVTVPLGTGVAEISLSAAD
jgi:cytoskeletal protein RodZ